MLEEIVVDDGETAALGAPIARLRRRAPPGRHVAGPAAVCRRHRRRARAGSVGRASAGAYSRHPVARRLAGELGVSLAGPAQEPAPGGRIVRADVRAAAATATRGRARRHAAGDRGGERVFG